MGFIMSATHGNGSFFIQTHAALNKSFDESKTFCHWHHDFEFGVLLEGRFEISLGGVPIELRAGEGYFVNSDVLHIGKPSTDTIMFTLTLPVDFLFPVPNSEISLKYLTPLLTEGTEGIKLSEGTPFGQELIEILKKIYALESSAFGYELECREHVYRLWLTLLHAVENENSADLHTGNQRYTDRMKAILSYVGEHKQQKITIEDIARHIGISRGECFRCFKSFTGKSIVGYINETRLQNAADLLRESEKTVTDISAECGFESVSYFGKLFKESYAMTPYQYKKAHIWTNNKTERIGTYDYEYYKNSGYGKMTIQGDASDGAFTCDWIYADDTIFRSGKKYDNHAFTHSQMGHITLDYAAECKAGNYNLCIYGWSVAPLVEWFIVEDYGSYKPMSHQTCLGTVETDGGTYEMYYAKRIYQPSILGTKSFEQFWSVRLCGRSSGTADISAHFRAWESVGMKLGNLAEIALSVENWQGGGGRAEIFKNVLTIV